MNDGDCSTCRRQKYCHHTCADAKMVMRRIAAEAFHAKMLEIMTRKPKKQKEAPDGL